MDKSTEELKEPSDLSKEEIESVSEEYVRQSLYVGSRLVGKDLLSQDLDDDTKKAIEKLRTFAQKSLELQQEGADESKIKNFWLSRLLELADDSFEIHEEALTDDTTDLASVLSNKMNKRYEEAVEEHREFGYEQYLRIISSIIQDLVEDGGIDEYRREASISLDVESEQTAIQRYISHHDDDFAFVEENREPTDAATVEELLQIYERRCEVYKKMIPRLLYAVDVLQDRDQDLEKLANKRLGTLLQMVGGAKYRRINQFTEPVDNSIRNAIAHEDYIIDPVKEVVEFRDRESEVATLDFEETREMVLETLCMTDALFRCGTMVSLEARFDEIAEPPDTESLF